MSEVRVWAEGTLRWVEASGGQTAASATGWVTASKVLTGTGTAAWAPLSGLLGFVLPGMTFNQPREYATVEDRGTPTMHKWTRISPPEITVRILEAVTGDWPTGNTAIGPSSLGLADVPSFNFEWRQAIPATESNLTGIYYQMHGVKIVDRQRTEQPEGNVLELRMRALAVNGPTASGYLS